MKDTVATVEIWELARPIGDVVWSALGAGAQKAIIQALAAADCVLILSCGEDGNFQVHTLPQTFDV